MNLRVRIDPPRPGGAKWRLPRGAHVPGAVPSPSHESRAMVTGGRRRVVTMRTRDSPVPSVAILQNSNISSNTARSDRSPPERNPQ